jgi:hypothetical protein
MLIMGPSTDYRGKFASDEAGGYEKCCGVGVLLGLDGGSLHFQEWRAAQPGLQIRGT